MKNNCFNSGLWQRIFPEAIPPGISIVDMIDRYFLAYNAGRLREVCNVMVEKIFRDDVVVGMSLAGAATPAGLGSSCLVPMMADGLIDYLVVTGANIYHDLHFALNLPLYRGSPFTNDSSLHRQGIVRIYDILMEYKVLATTDHWLVKALGQREFQTRMGTSRLHWLLGRRVHEAEQQHGTSGMSFLAQAYRCDVPVFTSSPGDSTIGLDIAALNLTGRDIQIDSSIDVNETTAIVYEAKKNIGKSGVVIWGGGSPKNFILQTEPALQEVLGFNIKGHDYFIQVTDARPDTGGLSGATPSEAVSWSKIDPDMLSDAVVCYADLTIIMPLVVAYLREKGVRRDNRRLYQRLPNLVDGLQKAFMEVKDFIQGKRSVDETIRFLRGDK
ncbi:MAG: deoxyhypusine synthase [Deltaproteobacteria bacterium]|nr:deoxyhypusine synthase [Deltaproteobacteria bacterium]